MWILRWLIRGKGDQKCVSRAATDLVWQLKRGIVICINWYCFWWTFKYRTQLPYFILVFPCLSEANNWKERTDCVSVKNAWVITAWLRLIILKIWQNFSHLYEHYTSRFCHFLLWCFIAPNAIKRHQVQNSFFGRMIKVWIIKNRTGSKTSLL